MIKNVSSSHNNYIKVTCTAGAYIPPYTSSPNVSGAMRYNPHNQALEVYDGMVWQNITGSVDISFTDEMTELLNWAREQMNKQKEIEQWAKRHPTVQAALEDLQLAQQRLNVVTILCKEEDQVKQ
jgi:hypothetical protein